MTVFSIKMLNLFQLMKHLEHSLLIKKGFFCLSNGGWEHFKSLFKDPCEISWTIEA
jgi:hypothetical protein